MKIIILILLLSSCTNYKKEIKQQLILQKSYDYRIWNLKDLSIIKKSNISPSCKEILFKYTIQLKEDCYPTKIVNNILINYFVDNQDYYQWDRCFSDSIMNKKIEKFKINQEKKINYQICSRRKHIVFGGKCIEWVKYTQKDLANDIKKYKEKILESQQDKFIVKNNVIDLEDTQRICD